MKRLILSLLLIPCISCLTTSEVYLPHTSRIFHKKNCVDLHDPNPIKYSSAQVALNTEGVAACSVCIKDKDLEVKSKSSVAIRVLGDILVFLGVVAIVAISASATPAQTYTIADKAVVVFYPSGCDYFIADGSKGFYLLEWYSGYDPSEGDLIAGDIGSYGFKDVYYPKQDRTGRVYVEDYLLSESSVIEEYNDQCD